MQLPVQGMGGGAAQQIHLVLAGGGDKQLRVPDPGLKQHVHGGAVALDADHVVMLHTGLQHSGVGIDDGNVMSLSGKLPGQHGTDLTVSRDDDVHKRLLDTCSGFLNAFFISPEPEKHRSAPGILREISGKQGRIPVFTDFSSVFPSLSPDLTARDGRDLYTIFIL